MPLISVVTPAFNEAESLPVLYDRLMNVFKELNVQWEWVVVDDHSNDETPEIIKRLCEQDEKVKTIRFSRNFGSHPAILAGLTSCSGDAAVVMASDLQDPPEIITRLIPLWRKGNKVVWAVRDKREGETFLTRFFSQLYNRLLRSTSSLKDIPSKGADMWLMDRQVINIMVANPELHSGITTLTRWMGFKQTSISYVKKTREFGKSKWSTAKKVKHAINTLVASTEVPIRLMSYIGIITSMLGFLYAFVVLANHLFFSNPIQGWTSLMIVLLVIGGFQMMMLGVLGEYLWRTYEESRKRPRYIIERSINFKPGDECQ